MCTCKISYYGKINPVSGLMSVKKLSKGRRSSWVRHPYLVHYDPSQPIRVAGDASNYGVQAVLSCILPDETKHPIAFTSHTLYPSERNYAQVEKEALSLVLGVQTFHKYIYGRQFTLVTDHNPLITILGPKTGGIVVIYLHLQHWILPYKVTCQCWWFVQVASYNPDSGWACTIHVQHLLRVTVTDPPCVQRATCTDPVLLQVYQNTQSGLPQQVPSDLTETVQAAYRMDRNFSGTKLSLFLRFDSHPWKFSPVKF